MFAVKKTLSLDIQTDFAHELDISGFFQISRLHAIDNGIFKPIVDEILPELPEISLFVRHEVEVDDFETFPTLDLVHSDLIASSFWQRKYPELTRRKQKIELVRPIVKPF